jgi:DNA polymerase III delta subunit
VIYLFYGEGRDKARAKWRAALATFSKKYPDGMVFHFDSDHFLREQFEELVSAGDLFGHKRLVAADRLLENEEAAEWLGGRIKDFVASPNSFLFLEIAPAKELIKKISAAGGKTEEHPLALKSAAPPFNIFSISDALTARDKKGLWLTYQKALRSGLAEEEIFWKLVWPIKTMLLVAKSGKGELKTVKPFVADKARRALAKYKIEELEKMSTDLVVLWHDSRRGLIDFDFGLEKFVLSI